MSADEINEESPLESNTPTESSGEQRGAKEKKVNSAGHNPNTAPPTMPKPTGGKPHPEGKKGLGAQLSSLLVFLRETWIEFRKISWPSRTQVLQETWSVIVLVSLITVSVLFFDFAIARVVFEPLDKFAKKQGGGVGRTTQTWGPMAPEPGAPTDQSGVPGNAPITPISAPGNATNESTVPGGDAGSKAPAAPSAPAAPATPAAPAAPAAPANPD